MDIKKYVVGSKKSSYMTSDTDAIYLYDFKVDELRTNFFHDIDKILYSLSFVRYMDKTQVFTFQKHDHLMKRMVHVQYVSKIARTIGRALGLNEDLIEAASLGHDLGHTPFGHAGEAIINEISLKNGEGYFKHNVQSVRLLKDIENYGKGLNVSVQVLDAILCHNGEVPLDKYAPEVKTKEEFLEQYELFYHDNDLTKYINPMTMEGCVVRISDLISYLGRDVEDGIRLNIIKKEDIPQNIVDTLGSTNSEIINTIVLDIIKNSLDKPYIKLSKNIYDAINELQRFNYEHIYYKANTDEDINRIKLMINTLFDKYKDDINSNNEESLIVKSYLNNMSKEYRDNNTVNRIVLDYISGMTDEFLFKEYNKYLDIVHNKKEVSNDL